MKKRCRFIALITVFAISLVALLSCGRGDELKSKEPLLENNGFPYEITKKLSDFTTNELKKQVESENAVHFDYVISEGDVAVIIATEIIKDESEQIKEIRVRVYYEWLRLPIFRRQDPITISWDAEKLEYKPESFYGEDRYSASSSGDLLHMKRENYFSGRDAHLCWYADLRDLYFDDDLNMINKLYGFGELVLEPTENYTSGDSIKIGVEYVHAAISSSRKVYMSVEYGACLNF